MKKIIAMIAAVAMIVTCATACGDNSTSSTASGTTANVGGSTSVAE